MPCMDVTLKLHYSECLALMLTGALNILLSHTVLNQTFFHLFCCLALETYNQQWGKPLA